MPTFGRLEFPLILDDSSESSHLASITKWLREVSNMIPGWELMDDEEKISALMRNLPAELREKAKKQGTMSYNGFKSWLREQASPAKKSVDSKQRLNSIVQTRSFLEYEQAFSAAVKQNRQSSNPLGEQTIISYFLDNMRNIGLQNVLSRREFADYDSIAAFAEDLIRKNRIKERFPSDYSQVPRRQGIRITSSSTVNRKSREGSLDLRSSNKDSSREVSRDRDDPQPDLFAGLTKDFVREDSSESEAVVSDAKVEAHPNEAWKTRMSSVLTDHPLKQEGVSIIEEPDVVKEWLATLEKVIDMLDFRSNAEEVSFCTYNARSIVAGAARRHGTFDNFFQFKKWTQDLYGIKDQKRDVVRSAIRTVQTGSLRRYIYRFRKLLIENEYCQFPVSPELIGEFFIENIRDEVLKSRFKFLKTTDLHAYFETAEDLLDKGDIPDHYPAWETQTPPFSNEPSSSWGSENTNGRSIASRQPKRTRTETVLPKQPRNVRVKGDPDARALELSTGIIQLSQNAFRNSQSYQAPDRSVESGFPGSREFQFWQNRDP